MHVFSRGPGETNRDGDQNPDRNTRSDCNGRLPVVLRGEDVWVLKRSMGCDSASVSGIARGS